MYIVRRTQLYLEEDVWKTLQIRSRQSGTTISALVREAVRGRYMNQPAERGQAMEALAGLRKDRPEFANAEEYVRRLRRGSRLERLARK